MNLSIIIPAYNEETRIEKSLIKAIEFLDSSQYSYEIIVVDDGSRDATIAKAIQFEPKVRVISQPRNMGKGAAVRTGMLASVGDVCFFTDADFSTPIHEINKLMKFIDAGADICIGSRAIDRSLVKEHQPFYRESMGKVFNYLVQFIALKGIKDTQCGFKAFSRKAVDTIFPMAKIDGFSFDVELLLLARKSGLRIEQTPVEWFNDLRSTVNPINDSIKMIIELFKIRRLHR